MPRVSHPLDTLNVAELPDTGGLGLDYRTETLSPKKRRFLAGRAIATALTLALVAVFITRTVFVHGSYWSEYRLGVSAVLGAIILIVWFLRGMPVEPITWPVTFGPGNGQLALALILLAPFIWGISRFTSLAADPLIAWFVLMPVALFFCWRLVERIATHYVLWMTANPNLSPERRAELEEIWKSRARSKGYKWSALRFLGIYAASATALLLSPVSLFSGMYAVGTFILLVFGILAVRERRRGFAVIAATGRAVVSWFTYNRHDIQAPGVFQSPYGSGSRRTLLASVLIFVVTLSITSAAAYFPVVLAAGNSGHWFAAYRESWFEWGAVASKRENHLPELREVEAGLSYVERRQFKRLSTHAERTDFLSALATRQEAVNRRRALQAEYVQFARELKKSPESWIGLAARGTVNGHRIFPWSVAISFLLCCFVPGLFWFATCVALVGPALRRYEELTEERHGANVFGYRAWQVYAERIRSSGHEAKSLDGQSVVALRDHLWLGTNDVGDYPVLLDRHILHEHAWLLGDSGSGKTSRGLAPMIAQLIRLADRYDQAEDHSVVVIDMKGGDAAFFNGVREEAEAAGLPFSWYTTVTGDSTHAFNPLAQSFIREGHLGTNELVGFLLHSLGLDYGTGYGLQHFSLSNKSPILAAMRTKPDIGSFRELREYLRDGRLNLSAKAREHAHDIFVMLEHLATLAPLNADPAANGVHSIDMMDVVRRPQVAYFHLPSTIDGSTAATIGRLALFSLLLSAFLHQQKHGRPRRVYLVIDEFQQLVSDNLKIFLRQARSMGISIILSNQTISDLRISRGEDLFPIVQGNTRFKQYFASSDIRQQQALMEAGGDIEMEEYPRWEAMEAFDPVVGGVANVPGVSEHMDFDDYDYVSTGVKKAFGPRVSRNDIIRMTDDENQAIVHMPRGRGYTQFGGFLFPIRTSHHISLSKKEELDAEMWPGHEPGTMPVGEIQVDANDGAWRQQYEGDPAEVDDEARARHEEKLREFLDDVDEREEGEW